MAALMVGPFDVVKCALEDLRMAPVSGRQAKLVELEKLVQAAISSSPKILPPSISQNVTESLSVLKASISSGGDMNLTSLDLAINQLIKSVLMKEPGSPAGSPMLSPPIFPRKAVLEVEELSKMEKRLLALKISAPRKEREEFSTQLSRQLKLWQDSSIPVAMQVRMLTIFELQLLLNSDFINELLEEARGIAGERSLSPFNSVERFEVELVAMENSLANLDELKLKDFNWSFFPESIRLFRGLKNFVIEGFPYLENLPDLRYFPLLERFRICGSKKVKTPPDTTGNPELISLFISWCSLETPPDLSRNPKLEMLNLYENALVKSPDLRNNPNLYYFKISKNRLETQPDIRWNRELLKLVEWKNSGIRLSGSAPRPDSVYIW